jgi:hypothetical protein
MVRETKEGLVENYSSKKKILHQCEPTFVNVYKFDNLNRIKLTSLNTEVAKNKK